jgi:hypothetical protein
LSTLIGIGACGTTDQAMTHSEASAQQPDPSLYWIERVTALEEVALPDEWYEVSIGDTGRRIDEMFRLIDRRADLSQADKAALRKELDNDGQPFIHRIFFNRPMPRGAPGEGLRGEGLITAVSMKNRASVAILLSEIRDVTAKRARLSAARIKEIESVFR